MLPMTLKSLPSGVQKSVRRLLLGFCHRWLPLGYICSWDEHGIMHGSGMIHMMSRVNDV